MAAWNKYLPWVEYLVEGANLGSDQFAVALTNTAPTNTHSLLSQITAIDMTNLSSRAVTTTSHAASGGTHDLVLADLTLTASDTVPTFRYVVLYDDTIANDPVCGWWDYGGPVDMLTSETFLIDFSAYTMRTA